MKILVFGASGFVGGAVSSALEASHEIFRVYSSGQENTQSRRYVADLMNPDAVSRVIEACLPEVVINAAGIVENTERAEANVEFTKNIVSALLAKKLVARLIVCGSAASYGVVEDYGIAVHETHDLNPTGPYGSSKKEEEEFALLHSGEGLDVIVARIFNPIGPGMHSKFLIPSIVRQIINSTDNPVTVDITRADSLRDLLDVRDLGRALALLATTPSHQYDVYNIGSGKDRSNKELVQSVALKMHRSAIVREISAEREKPVASRADIARIYSEFGWKPEINFEQTIGDIVNEQIK